MGGDTNRAGIMKAQKTRKYRSFRRQREELRETGRPNKREEGKPAIRQPDRRLRERDIRKEVCKGK
jgi:hypothetical protein